MVNLRINELVEKNDSGSMELIESPILSAVRNDEDRESKSNMQQKVNYFVNFDLEV